jgi:hypothetical protein
VALVPSMVKFWLGTDEASYNAFCKLFWLVDFEYLSVKRFADKLFGEFVDSTSTK